VYWYHFYVVFVFFCACLLICTCVLKPAIWLIRIELDSNGSCLPWEYFGLLAYLWAGCGNVILILVVNIVSCLFLKGYDFISVKHETKLWRWASTKPTATHNINYLMYLLTAIGFPPGGSSTVHIYIQTIYRTTQNKQYIEQHKIFWKSAGRAPSLRGTLTFALQLRKKHGKTSVRVAEKCCDKKFRQKFSV